MPIQAMATITNAIQTSLNLMSLKASLTGTLSAAVQ